MCLMLEGYVLDVGGFVLDVGGFVLDVGGVCGEVYAMRTLYYR